MLYPMFAMVIVTFAVATYLFRLRVKAVKAGEVRLSQLRLNTGEIPDAINQAARNYTNLFEVPMLFYTAGAIAIALGIQVPSMVITAWVFVLARCAHSWIHLTSNNVIHRVRAYMLGNVCVLVIWGILVASYATR
ncbi:MAG TPA: MAPEG family protein [Cellvibrio sp.]|nr:MAPEG family protein [Cellvibrio sp.]